MLSLLGIPVGTLHLLSSKAAIYVAGASMLWECYGHMVSSPHMNGHCKLSDVCNNIGVAQKSFASCLIYPDSAVRLPVSLISAAMIKSHTNLVEQC